jgi:alcohol dehydrogenase (cytochrome c)
VWVTGTYDPVSNQTLWGTGNPVSMFDPFYRPGDNLYIIAGSGVEAARHA